MAEAWEETFWLLTWMTNSVLGFHIIFRSLLSSWYPFPILATVATVFLLTVYSFSQNYRHKSYFKTKTKIIRCILLEIGIVPLSEVVFFELGYKKWISPVAWVVYMIPALVPKPPASLLVADDIGISLSLTGSVFWDLWCGKDGSYASQLIIGLKLVGLSGTLIAYHWYVEVDRAYARRPVLRVAAAPDTARCHCEDSNDD